VGVEKSFVGRKHNTKYFMTKEGKKAFSDHLNALEKIIQSHRQD
jgi:hypothetical protein